MKTIYEKLNMIINIYILLIVLSFLIMLLGLFFMAFASKPGIPILFLLMSAILFGLLALYSFNVTQDFCHVVMTI